MSVSLQKVAEGIYLGDYNNAMNSTQLINSGITHILSCCKMDTLPGFVHKIIAIDDTEHTNILQHFESGYQFITFARNESKVVLVHCVAGMSRSVAMLCAYFMKIGEVGYDLAIKRIREVSESAWYVSFLLVLTCSPNDGFVTQLRLFEEMNWKIDTLNDAYKQFRIMSLAAEYQGTSYPLLITFREWICIKRKLKFLTKNRTHSNISPLQEMPYAALPYRVYNPTFTIHRSVSIQIFQT